MVVTTFAGAIGRKVYDGVNLCWDNGDPKWSGMPTLSLRNESYPKLPTFGSAMNLISVLFFFLNPIPFLSLSLSFLSLRSF